MYDQYCLVTKTLPTVLERLQEIQNPGVRPASIGPAAGDPEKQERGQRRSTRLQVRSGDPGARPALIEPAAAEIMRTRSTRRSMVSNPINEI